MKQTKQMSESIRLGMLLAISGGFMDAYSYIARDHVFANAQTGNMLLLGVSLSEGNFQSAARYFSPCLRSPWGSYWQSWSAEAKTGFYIGGRVRF